MFSTAALTKQSVFLDWLLDLKLLIYFISLIFSLQDLMASQSPLMLNSTPAFTHFKYFLFFIEVCQTTLPFLSIVRDSLLLFLFHRLLFVWSPHTSGRTPPSLAAVWCFGGRRWLWLAPFCGSWSRLNFGCASAAPDWPAISQPASPGCHYSVPTCSKHIHE